MNTVLIVGVLWLVLIVLVLVAWRRFASRRPRTVSDATKDHPGRRSPSNTP